MYTIAETFVGAGGAHLGFINAGFKSIFVNDIDKDTIKTLIINKVVKEEECFIGPIEDISEDRLKDIHPDVLFGGIVCKGFSLAGVRNPFDERNYLYIHQLRLVKILNPKVSIIENVVAIQNMFLYRKCYETENAFKKYTELSDINKQLNGEKSSRRKNNNQGYSDLTTQITTNKKKMDEILSGIEEHKYSVISDIEKMYGELGYKVSKKVLQTDKYGGYTNRKRIIIVAVRNDIKGEFRFPEEQTTTYTIGDALNLIDYDGVNNPRTDVDNKPMSHTKKTVDR